MLSQLADIGTIPSILVVNYTISPFGENLHSVIVDCTFKFKHDWITILLLLNLHYQIRFYPILNCYTTI